MEVLDDRRPLWSNYLLNGASADRAQRMFYKIVKQQESSQRGSKPPAPAVSLDSAQSDAKVTT